MEQNELEQALSIVVLQWNGKATNMEMQLASRVPHSKCPLFFVVVHNYALLCFALLCSTFLLQVVQWPVNYAALIFSLICLSHSFILSV